MFSLRRCCFWFICRYVFLSRNRNTGAVEQGVKSWRLSFYGPTATSPVHSASNAMYQSLSTRKKRRAPEPPRTPGSTEGGRLAASSGKVAAPSVPCSMVASNVTPCQNIAEHEVALPPVLVTSPSVEDGQCCGTLGGTTDSQASTVGSTSPLSFKSLSDQKNASRLTPSMKGVLAPTNTRLIGRKISVELTKGSNSVETLEKFIILWLFVCFLKLFFSISTTCILSLCDILQQIICLIRTMWCLLAVIVLMLMYCYHLWGPKIILLCGILIYRHIGSYRSGWWDKGTM